MITRSGTNSFHGEAYDFIRNTITDANNWFNDQNGVPIPPVHRHDFGGTFGGPIIKNKTFFFFDWDGTLASTMGTYQAGVPSAAERNRRFWRIVRLLRRLVQFDSGICSVSSGQIFDPYSGVYGVAPDGVARGDKEHLHSVQQRRHLRQPGDSPSPNLTSQPSACARRTRQPDRFCRVEDDEFVPQADR